MKIAVVTDEISGDIETALELANRWGVDGVELRGISTERYPRLSRYWADRVPELIAESGLAVSAISSGLFKIPYPRSPGEHTKNLRWEDYLITNAYAAAIERVNDHIENLLPETIAAADSVGTDTLICFSFDRGEGVPPGPAPEFVVEALRRTAEEVSAAGKRLAVEVEHICWADTGFRTKELVERVDHPGLEVNWDPANTVLSGDNAPYPAGYEAIRPYLGHVHFKDAQILEDGSREFSPRGIVDWENQIRALQQDGYNGWVVVETHARPKLARTEEALDRLRGLIGGDA